MPARRILGTLLFALPFLVAGCAQEMDVTSYDVDYPDREKIRLLTAIVPDGETTWVFKLQGPDAAVAAQKKAFDDLIASVRLDEKKDPPISWTKPEDWQEEDGGGEFRIKTLRIAAGARPMEVAVSMLPKLTAPGEKDEKKRGNSVLDNVNRWRRQMTLPAIEAADLEKNIRREKVDGREVILANISALGTYRVPVRNPRAGLAKAQAGGQPKLGGGKGTPFTFEVPKGWVPRKPLPQFSLAAYEVVDGKFTATISLSQAGGDDADNINRWREQVGLQKTSRAEINRDAKAIKVAGIDAKYVDLANPKSAQPNNRILGVIVPSGDGAYFIKMAGPDALLGAQKTKFEAFVKSFQAAPE